MPAKLTWAQARRRGIAALDPYTQWLAAAGGAAFELSASLAPGGGNYVLSLATGDTGGPSDPASVTWDFTDPAGAERRSRIALTEVADLGQLLDPTADTESHIHLAPLHPDQVPAAVDTLAEPAYTAPEGLAPEAVVVLGIIDDAINPNHDRFIDRHGAPRTDYFWLQDGAAVQDAPSPVLFGREITRADLEDARARHGGEEEILRDLRLLDFRRPEVGTLGRRFSHGSYVLDKMAGYPSDPRAYADGLPAENNGTDPVNRRIVAVQLHRQVSTESSGALYTLFAVAGIRYIVQRARTIAAAVGARTGRKVPLVINFSYGLSGGPHNGAHPIERAVEQVVTGRDLGASDHLGPVMVPMATGNRYLLQGHACATAASDGPATLEVLWKTAPGDRSPNYLELWLPRSAEGGEMELTLAPLTSARADPTTMTLDLDLDTHGDDPEVEAWELTDPDGAVLGRVSVDRLDARQMGGGGATDKLRVLIALGPTAPVREGAPHMPPGEWRVVATVPLATGDRIEAWIPRDDQPPGFRRQGIGSQLQDRTTAPQDADKAILEERARDLAPECGMRRYGTISGMATAPSMIRVAGSRVHEGDLPALYSGAASEALAAPDLCAPSDRSNVFGGILGAASRSGGSLVINGTSVAAPYVARACADFLAAQTGPMTGEEARQAFLAQVTDAPPLPDTPTGRVYEADPDLKRWRGRDRVLKRSALPQDRALER